MISQRETQKQVQLLGDALRKQACISAKRPRTQSLYARASRVDAHIQVSAPSHPRDPRTQRGLKGGCDVRMRSGFGLL